MIHPTAIINPKAQVHESVQVGPYAVIDADVELGADCIVGPHVYITGKTRIGSGNRFFAGCVIGEAPQDLKYSGALTGVRIGDRNVFREHVTVHRSTKPEEDTIIGSDNFLMANAHVAHNCRLHNSVIMANGALLGGHAEIFDRAFISGNCLVHQFTRVGTLAMMQGGSAASKDVPPFTIAHHVNTLAGLNVVGMRRAGINSADRLELKKLYHLLYRAPEHGFRHALAATQSKFSSGVAQQVFEFLSGAKRGICMASSSIAGTQKTDE